MKAIKSKDTSIELKLRKELWKQGIRYRKNYSKLYGKPDIVITKHKIVIFCDSEFWHGFNWDNGKDKIKSNPDYWIPKIERNVQRDLEVNRQLSEEGWIIMRFWEKEIRKDTSNCVNRIKEAIKQRESKITNQEFLTCGYLS